MTVGELVLRSKNTLPDDMPASKAASLYITYQTGYVGLHLTS